MSKRKFSGNVSGKGYYIALILCAVAIGISGYLYYRNTSKPAMEQEVVQTPVDAPAEQEDVPAAATQPQEELPVVSQQVEEKTPAKRVTPVEGQTLAGYAADCLSYNQTTRDWRTHDGIDLAAQAGTQVLAAADGEVYSVYEDETMGVTVVLVHDDGYATTYSSLQEEPGVKPGDRVQAGQVIGAVGRTALLESALGDHVHFSVSRSGQNVDPQSFLAGE